MIALDRSEDEWGLRPYALGVTIAATAVFATSGIYGALEIDRCKQRRERELLEEKPSYQAGR